MLCRIFLILLLLNISTSAAIGKEPSDEYTETLKREVQQHHPDFDPEEWRRDRKLQFRPESNKDTEQYLNTMQTDCAAYLCTNCKSGHKTVIIDNYETDGTPNARCVECLTNQECTSGINCHAVLHTCKQCLNSNECPENYMHAIYFVAEAVKEYYTDKGKYPDALGIMIDSSPSYISQYHLNAPGYEFNYKNLNDNFKLHFVPSTGWGFYYFTDNTYIIRYKKNALSGPGETPFK